MILRSELAGAYLDHAFAQMLAVADRLGDPLVNERPLGPSTNAVAGLVVHCCGVAEFWLGHVVLGRPSRRDRDAEFGTAATLVELHALVAGTQTQVHADLAAIDRGEGIAGHPARAHLIGCGEGDAEASDASAVVHVLEELYQHLGHMELAADALLR